MAIVLNPMTRDRRTTRLLSAGLLATGEATSGSLRDPIAIRRCGYFFEYLEDDCDIAPEAFDTVRRLQVGITRTWIEQQSSQNHANHPIRKFVDLVVNVCKSFDGLAGERARKLMDQVGDIVDRAAESEVASEQVYYEATRRLADLLNQYNNKCRVFEKRLIETELGRSQSRDAYSLIRKETLDAVVGNTLPSVFFDFIHEIWEKYLYVTYLQQGMDSTAWNEAIADTKALVWCLTTQDRSALFLSHNKVFDVIKRVNDAVNSICITTANDLIRTFFETVEYIVIRRLQGEEPEIPNPVEVPPLHGARDEDACRCDVQSSDMDIVEVLRIGDWFLECDSQRKVRHKLVEKNDRYRYLLFTNLSGIRSLRITYNDAAIALTKRKLRRTGPSPVFAKALDYAGRRLALTQRAKRRDWGDEKRPQTDYSSLEFELNLEENADPHVRPLVTAPQDDYQARGGRLINAAEDTPEHPELAETEPQLRSPRRGLRMKKESEILLGIRKMKLGGWAQIVTEKDETILARLGLKSAETGRLLFVDSAGMKLAEFSLDEFAHRIANGSAVVLDSEPFFDDWG